MNWPVRLLNESDVVRIEGLIPLSARGLQSDCYSKDQIEAALGPVFAVDRQLIADGTYFGVEDRGELVGCGGWSRRQAQFGGDHGRKEPDPMLVPGRDAARIRAFFVHPAYARRGIGRVLLERCEKEMAAAGFDRVDLVATLAGERLYGRFGYAVIERYAVPLAGGLSLPVVRMAKSMA